MKFLNLNRIFLFIFLCFTCSVWAFKNNEEFPQPLTLQQVRNLEFFAKIYGSVRYFYPSKAALETDWDKFSIYGIQKVWHCQNDQELIAQINELFLPLCSKLKINSKYPDFEVITNSTKYKVWEHYGNGNPAMKIPLLYNPYHSKVKSLKKGDSIYYYTDKVDNNLYFSIPTASDEHTIHADFKTLEQHFDSVSTNKMDVKEQKITINVDKHAYQLASIIQVWNNMFFFFPYKDLLNLDWNKYLQKSLNETVLTSNYRDFYFVFCKMLSQLNDGHINAPLAIAQSYGLYARQNFTHPFRLIAQIFIDDKNVVLIDGDSLVLSQIPKGAIIDSINHVSGCAWVEQQMEYMSGSKQRKYYLLQRDLFQSYTDSVFQISYTFSGIQNQVTLTAQRQRMGYYSTNTKPVLQEQTHGIYSLNLGSLEVSNKTIKNALNELHKNKDLKGIIVDFRSPRYMNYKFLQHFTSTDIYCTDLNVVVKTSPDRFRYDTERWKVKGNKNAFKVPVVFLIDASIQSYGETLIEMVDYYKLAKTVGTNTSGANGDVAKFYTPVFNIYYYTGMRVDKHDGTPFFGTGIAPNYPVPVTAQEILNGVDSQMQKALEVINQSNIK